MRISIIVAMDMNGIIGTDAGLPWHLPRDLKHFRTMTTGKPIILGRRTLDLIGHPLPKRSNIVLTRAAYFARTGVQVAHGIAEAIDIGRSEASALGADEIMVIGGGEVYREFLPLADRIYLTIVHEQFKGTATFPLHDLYNSPFANSHLQFYPADQQNPFAMTMYQLDRIARDSSATGASPRLLLNVA